jgi:hypothetical protein
MIGRGKLAVWRKSTSLTSPYASSLVQCGHPIRESREVPSLCAMSSAGAVEIVDLTDSPEKRESPAGAVEPSGKTRFRLKNRETKTPHTCLSQPHVGYCLRYSSCNVVIHPDNHAMYVHLFANTFVFTICASTHSSLYWIIPTESLQALRFPNGLGRGFPALKTNDSDWRFNYLVHCFVHLALKMKKGTSLACCSSSPGASTC